MIPRTPHIPHLLLLTLLLGGLSAFADREGDREHPEARHHRDGDRERPEARHHRDGDRERPEARPFHREGDRPNPEARPHRDGDREHPEARFHREGDRPHPEARFHRDGDREREGEALPFRAERDRDREHHPRRDHEEDWEADFENEGPFRLEPDDFDDEDDPFADQEVWIEEELRRVMSRGGLPAVSRMVGREFGTPEHEFQHFVKEHMPEVLQAKGPRAAEMVTQAVYTYSNFVEIREHDPEQAGLMVQHDRMEMMSQQLAENIEILRRRARRDGNTEVKQMLGKNENQLKQVLGQLFEVRQRQQELEVRDLEAEVRELRDLAKRRAENRDRIVERQFLELTGQGRALEF
jgi:hypothetical protein